MLNENSLRSVVRFENKPDYLHESVNTEGYYSPLPRLQILQRIDPEKLDELHISELKETNLYDSASIFCVVSSYGRTESAIKSGNYYVKFAPHGKGNGYLKIYELDTDTKTKKLIYKFFSNSWYNLDVFECLVPWHMDYFYPSQTIIVRQHTDDQLFAIESFHQGLLALLLKGDRKWFNDSCELLNEQLKKIAAKLEQSDDSAHDVSVEDEVTSTHQASQANKDELENEVSSSEDDKTKVDSSDRSAHTYKGTLFSNSSEEEHSTSEEEEAVPFFPKF